MEQDLSTHRCRAKSAKTHDVTSSDSIRDEYPCKRAETAISPTQPASTETYQEKAQETYPWIKEVRSKGTKPNSIFLYFCREDVHGTIRGRGSIAIPSLLVRISHAAIVPKSKNKSLEY